MTTAETLLASLQKTGVKLWVQDGRLHYRSPAGALRDEDLGRIRLHKAELIDSLQRARRGAGNIPPLVARAREAAAQLSHAQERLWFLEQLGLVGPAYNVPVVFELNGQLDVRALERAFVELIERHESLRTRFESVRGEVRQLIGSAEEFRLETLDLSELPAAQRAIEVQRLVEEEVQGSFDLERGPLFRVALLRLGEQQHVLRMGMHHIISDGWSVGVLVRDLSALYTARVRGAPASLPELPVQYADYAQWQRQWLQGEALEGQLRYWKGQLEGAAGALQLPTDRVRPAAPSFKGGEVTFELGVRLTEKLKALSKQEGATLYMVLLAAFQVLLWRWSGQRDVVVGSPIAGRTHRELENLIGFFVNMLVLRTQLQSGESFRQLVGRVNRTALEAYAHQDLPFEKLVTELQPQRDLSLNPLFQVTFTFQPAADRKRDFAGLAMKPLSGDHLTAKFDLSLYAGKAPTGLFCAFEYATDLFDRSTIERMAGHFRTLLEAAASDPQGRIDDLPLLTAEERAELSVKWNARPAQYGGERCIHELISEQALRTPRAAAVVSEGRQLTYEQLVDRSNQLAQHLRGLGVGAEMVVGLCVERSVELVIGVLGILKAGGAYLPLDPGYPAERLAYMLTDAKVSVLVTQQALDAQLPPLPLHKLWLDAPAIAAQPACAPPVDVTPGNLAYVIYTSGSTGRPKGVMVTHRNVLRLFSATRPWFNFGAEDVWTLFHSYAFDFSVWEIFGALLHGGKLVVVPFLTTRSTQQFCDLLLRERVTVLNQTPSAFRQLVRLAADEPNTFSSGCLRLVIFGGEALNAPGLRPWFASDGHGRCVLVNMYGITETTVHVTYRLLTADDLSPGAGSPIGAPIPDMRVYVLDEKLSAAPTGLAGEIYVSGEGLARGYLNRARLTAERFLPDPYGPAGARMYRSGDLGRYRQDGELEFLGRADQQVKLRGHRIEPGEIEACLNRLDGVREALVSVVDSGGDDQRLVAWLVAAPGAVIDRARCRTEVARQLPGFMAPSDFIQIDRIPLTSNGKLDASQLPIPQFRARDQQTAYIPPGNLVEETLASIWEETLGVERASVDDNFFALGGDSIRALQVVRAAANRGIAVTAADVFRHQTIAELARAADASASASREPPPLHLLGLPPGARESFPASVTDAYPLTSMQALMARHYADNLKHQLGIYHVQQCLRVRDSLASPAAMRNAIELLVAAQPVLRTVFVASTDGALLQGILAAGRVDFRIVDLSSASAAEQEREIERVTLQDRGNPFPADGSTPLLRFCWFQTADDEFRLLMSIHHAIDDGWGNQHFLAQLFDSYRHSRRGARFSAPPAENVFKQFVALEREIGQAHEAQQFWASQQLDPLGRSVLQRLDGEPQNRGGQSITIGPELTRRLQALSRRLAVSLKAVLLSAYAELIARDIGVVRPTVGVVANGRTDRLSDPLNALGLFWNLAPFCPRPTAATGLDGIRLTQQVLVATEPYATYPLARIAESRGVDELFFATFNFVNFHNAARLNAVADLVVLDVQGHDKFHFPLNYLFAVVRTAGVIAVQVQYSNEFFTDAKVQRLNAGLLEILEAYAREEP